MMVVMYSGRNAILYLSMYSVSINKYIIIPNGYRTGYRVIFMIKTVSIQALTTDVVNYAENLVILSMSSHQLPTIPHN